MSLREMVNYCLSCLGKEITDEDVLKFKKWYQETLNSFK